MVLLEALRNMYGWDFGTAFTVVVYKGAIIMKPIRTPTEAELDEEFDEAFTESRQQARAAGMPPSDIRQAILEVRS